MLAASMQPRPHGRGNDLGLFVVRVLIRGFNAAAASRPRKYDPDALRAAAVHYASMQPRPHGRGNGAAMSAIYERT